MKRIFTRAFSLALVILIPFLCHAQGGTWTWMHGSNLTGSIGDYGTKGVAAATNEPPGRYQACYWTDQQGNFWLFGGVMKVNNFPGLGNDLWKYDVSAGMWTWMSGPNVNTAPNASGTWGTKGVPSVNNYPSARGYGANCWTDNNGDLWLYGGSGGQNDLWRYHIATNEWTWVNGSQTGLPPAVYGTQGVPSTTNTPGALAEVKSAWVDASNNLWMYGGDFKDNIWRYNIAADTWTWVYGGGTTASTGVYGTYQVESPTNKPSGRYSYTRWKDATGNMYLFAGQAPNGSLNDVWRYRPSNGQWTWVGGSNALNDTGKYPPLYCRFYDNYYPPARYENQTAFSLSACAKAFWTFGGFNNKGFLNDLWLYAVDSLKWAFVSGSRTANDTGKYGTLGTPAASNMPRSRGGQCMWIDNNNNLWLFGGYGPPGYVFLNDLWRFQADPACIDFGLLAGSNIKLPDTALCLGQRTTMNIGRHQSVSFSPGTGITPNIDSSSLVFAPTATTSYQVIVIGGGCNNNDTVNFTISVSPRDTVKLGIPHPLSLCLGDTAKMSVKPGWKISVTPATDVTYASTGGNSIAFYPSTTTSYVVVASNPDRCAISPDTARFTIQNDGITRHIPAMTDTSLCKGDTAIYLPVEKLDFFGITPNKDFLFLKNQNLYKFFPQVTTRYTFVGIQKAGCNPHDTIIFNIHRSTLRAAFTISPEETVIQEPLIQLLNYSTGATAYNWYHGNDFLSTDKNTTYTVTDTGIHCFSLAATDELNCVDTAIECGRVVDPQMFVPTAFTPNGDGRNDVFRPLFRDVTVELVSVYNRWGQRVFVSYDGNFGWDGTYGNKRCDVGTYFYLIKYHILHRPAVTLKGDLMLIR